MFRGFGGGMATDECIGSWSSLLPSSRRSNRRTIANSFPAALPGQSQSPPRARVVKRGRVCALVQLLRAQWLTAPFSIDLTSTPAVLTTATITTSSSPPPPPLSSPVTRENINIAVHAVSPSPSSESHILSTSPSTSSAHWSSTPA